MKRILLLTGFIFNLKAIKSSQLQVDASITNDNNQNSVIQIINELKKQQNDSRKNQIVLYKIPNRIIYSFVAVDLLSLILAFCNYYFYYQGTANTDHKWGMNVLTGFKVIFHLQCLYILWQSINSIRKIGSEFYICNKNAYHYLFKHNALPFIFLCIFLGFYMYDTKNILKKKEVEFIKDDKQANTIIKGIEEYLSEQNSKKIINLNYTQYIIFTNQLLIIIKNISKQFVYNTCQANLAKQKYEHQLMMN